MSRYTSYLAKRTSHFGILPGFSLDDLPLKDTPAGLVRGLTKARAAHS